jgi:glycosyltransferase involved in cell wall biosynthesis
MCCAIMRILQVIPYFTPKRGGDVNVCYNLSKQLVNRGHEVTIIATDFEFDEGYAKSLVNVRIIPFKVTVRIGLFLISLSMKKWLKKEIKNYDVIHLHNLQSYQNNVVYHYARKYGIPYVLQAHGLAPRMMKRSMLKKLYNWVWGYSILKTASKAFALTKMELDEHKEMGVGEDRIEIVPNGIDLSEYEAPPRRGEFRKKYGIKDDEKIVLYLGRIHKIKGIDLLVNAFAEIVEELDNIKLIIVGPDYGFLSILKRQIEGLKIGNKILFTGPIYGRDKLEAYVDADVYVLPSVYEAFPTTVLEAWACGTPVIITDRCGIADIVDGRAGCVVEYDKDQMQNAIIKILSDEELRRGFREEGRKLVKNEFGWEGVVLDIEKIYLGLIGR